MIQGDSDIKTAGYFAANLMYFWEIMGVLVRPVYDVPPPPPSDV